MLKYHSAYTLIELLIVIAIIGLMAVFAIPAYLNYGHRLAFSQKAEEVKELINQTYISAKNPEQGVKEYVFVPDLRSDVTNQSFSLYKVTASGFSKEKIVPIVDKQSLHCSIDGATSKCAALHCPTTVGISGNIDCLWKGPGTNLDDPRDDSTLSSSPVIVFSVIDSTVLKSFSIGNIESLGTKELIINYLDN